MKASGYKAVFLLVLSVMLAASAIVFVVRHFAGGASTSALTSSLHRAAAYDARSSDVRRMARQRAAESDAMWSRIDRSDKNQLEFAIGESRRMVAGYLRNLRIMSIPGVYLSKQHSAMVLAESPDAVSREMHEEEQSLVKWQLAIKSEIEATVGNLRFNALQIRNDERSKVPLEVCREFDLSRQERHVIEFEHDWRVFRSLPYANLRFDSVVAPHIPACPADNSWQQWRTRAVMDAWTPLGNPCDDIFSAFDEYVGICRDRLRGRGLDDVQEHSELLVCKLSSRALIWLLRQYCLDWGDEDDAPWHMMKCVRRKFEGDKPRQREIEWIDAALKSPYGRKHGT